VAVCDGELGDQFFAFVLVKHHVFLGCATDKEIAIGFLLLPCDSVVVGDAGVGSTLFMFKTLLVLVVFAVQRVVETETVYVAVCAGCDDLGIVGRYDDVLYIVGKGEEMQGLVVYGVVYEDVLLLVNGQEVPAMAVLNNAAVGDLQFLEHFQGVPDDCEDLEHRREANG
jgi:hypothetical protein